MIRQGRALRRVAGYVWDRVYQHLILPFQETHAPIWEVAWGASIGMFVGLTPTMGVQMYVTALIWLVCRYLLRFPFHLGIAIAMVWVSNPITFIPLYFLYLKTGDWLLGYLGFIPDHLSFAMFRESVLAMQGQEIGWLHRLLSGLYAIVVRYGWAIVVGSIVYTIPGTVLAYPVTALLLRRYRERLAAQEGITYQQWREKYEHLE